MSLDTPKDNFPEDNSREAMEARLTALALGELSADEEAALRAEMAKDPELAKLQERLARTIGLIGEAAGSLTGATIPQAEQLRLSTDRREKLLESFKVVRPNELVKRRRLNWRLKSRELAALAAMMMALLAVVVLLNLDSEDSPRHVTVIAGLSEDSEVTFSSYERAKPQAKESGRNRKAQLLSDKASISGQLDPKQKLLFEELAAKRNRSLGVLDGGVEVLRKRVDSADSTLAFTADAGGAIPAPKNEVESFDMRLWDNGNKPPTQSRVFTVTPGGAPAVPDSAIASSTAGFRFLTGGRAGVPPPPALPSSPPPVAESKESGREHYFAPIALPSAGDGLVTTDGEGTRSRNDLDSTDKGKVDNNSANFFGDGRAKQMISDTAGKPAEVALGSGRGGQDNNRPGQSSSGPAEYASVSVAAAGGALGGGGQKLGGARAGGGGQGGLPALEAPKTLGAEPAGALGRTVATAEGFGVQREYRNLNRNGRFEGLDDLAQKPKAADHGVFTFALVKDEVAGLKQPTQPLAIPAPATVNAGAIAGNPTAANAWFGNEAKPAALPSPTVAGGYGFANPVPVELKAKADSLASSLQGAAAEDFSIEVLRGDQGITVNRTGGAVGPTNAVQAGGGSGPAASDPRGYRSDVTGTNGTFDTGFITLTNRSEIAKFYSGTEGTHGTRGVSPNRANGTGGTGGQVAVGFFAGEPSLVKPGTFVAAADPATGLPVSGGRNFGGTADAVWASPDISEFSSLDAPLGKQRALGGRSMSEVKQLDDAVQLKRSSQLGSQIDEVEDRFGRPALDRSGVDAIRLGQLAQDASPNKPEDSKSYYRLRAPNQEISEVRAGKERSATTETRSWAMLDPTAIEAKKEGELAQNTDAWTVSNTNQWKGLIVGAAERNERVLFEDTDRKRNAVAAKPEASRFTIALPKVLEDNLAEKPLRLGSTVINETMYDPVVTARAIPARTLRMRTAQPDVPVDPAVEYINMAVQKKQVEATGRTFPPLPPLNDDEVAVKVGDVQTADLSKVLETYQELSGREVQKAPSLPSVRITMEGQSSLSRKDAAATLETVLAQNQITMVPQGTKFVKAVPQTQAFQEGKELEDLPTELAPESVVTHVVQLTNALPNDMVQVLQPFGRMPQSVVTVPGTANIVIRDSPENVKRMVELVHKVDAVPEQGGVTVGRQQSNTGLSSGGGGLGGGRGGFGSSGVPGLAGYNPKPASEEESPEKKELARLLEVRDRLYGRAWQEKVEQAISREAIVEVIDPAVAEAPKKSGLWNRVSGIFGSDSERTVKLAVEKDATDIESLGARAAGGFDPFWVQTQFEKIQSKLVLGKVIEKLNLNEAWAGKPGQKLSTDETFALLKKRLVVRQDPKSNLFDITAKSDDPEEAARIANAVAAAYRQTRLDRWTSLSEKGLGALEKGMETYNQKISELHAKIESRKKETNREPDVPLPKLAPTAAIPQPEISIKENAFSTFSLNVSDVSFKLAAAALEKGQMPDAATVRSEEFINAFDYHDPEPKGSAPIAFVSERARYPFAHNRDLLRFSIKTAASGRLNGRPLNLVLLLDNSGSMERADRVSIIRECLRVLATQLRPEDRVSVVAFARTARLWIDGMPGNQAGELAERVGGLSPQGGTNLEEAMNLAYQTALRHFMANGVNRVVLLTDGAANLGDVQPASLKKKVETHRQQGVALDCFGIGWDGLNDDLLETLSRNGDGRYGFINSPAAAATEFAGQLAGALQIAASDVKVQVEFNPKRVTSYRQIGYAKHQLKKEQFRDNTVDAAEIAAAEAGNALYTVEVNPSGEGPVATVRVRFKIPGSMDFREHEWAVPYEGPAKALEQSTATLRLAGAASAFSEWLVSSPFAGEVTTDVLLKLMSGVPESFSSDPRPKKLVEMLRQAKSLSGK